MDGHLELGGILLDSERVLRPSTLHAQLLAVLTRKQSTTPPLVRCVATTGIKPGIAPKPFVPIRYDPDDQAPFSPRSALCGGLGVCPGPKKCYEKVNDDRATYKEGVRAAYKCAEGPPGSKWNLAGDLPPTTIRRRANAKELRRAYDRAREELKALEREARPKERKTN